MHLDANETGKVWFTQYLFLRRMWDSMDESIRRIGESVDQLNVFLHITVVESSMKIVCESSEDTMSSSKINDLGFYFQ